MNFNRITKNYLILLEPAYDFSSEEAKKRMENHGYAIKIYDECAKGNFNIIKHELFRYSPNKLNPTGITIIKKEKDVQSNEIKYICPITKIEIAYTKNGYYSKDSGLLYPVVEKIPCLLRNNAILVTHLSEFE